MAKGRQRFLRLDSVQGSRDERLFRISGAGGPIFGGDDDPFFLLERSVLVGEALLDAEQWVRDNEGYRLEEVEDLPDDPEIVERIEPALAYPPVGMA